MNVLKSRSAKCWHGSWIQSHRKKSFNLRSATDRGGQSSLKVYLSKSIVT